MRGKHLTMSLRTSLLVACLVFGWHTSEASDLDSPLPKTVLAVYSLHRDSPLNVAFDSGLQRALKSSAGTTVDYYSEFMDSRRFSSETDLVLMREYLRQKYGTRKNRRHRRLWKRCGRAHDGESGKSLPRCAGCFLRRR